MRISFLHHGIPLLLLTGQAHLLANNIQVTNVSLTDQNTTDNFTMVEFDISWENSWRLVGGPANWDAAWVFLKYRVGAGPWLHAWINNTGHTAPSGSTISTGLLEPGLPYNNMTNPGMGAFIYRSGPGSGTFSLANVKLRWNYGDNGLDDNAQVDIKVFAVEHVYVPSGSYYLGSGGAESGAFYRYEPPAKDPYQVMGEGAIPIGQNIGELYYDNPSGFSGDRLGPLPAAFPKGFNAVYVMKYEVSQQGYIDFLNTLSRAQQVNRVRADITPVSAPTLTTPRYVMSDAATVVGNNGIWVPEVNTFYDAPLVFYADYNGNAVANEPGDGQDKACNFLSLADVMAYLDWAGLRLMTELEFEKCARGPIDPNPNEFAWGSTYYLSSDPPTNPGFPNEGPAYAGENCSWVGYPRRCGSFASSSSDRVMAGAGYYGNMELSGNVWERGVSVGSPSGRAYDGRHGDGLLGSGGDANVMHWPSSVSAAGSAFRGGCGFLCDIVQLRLSERSFAANEDPLGYGWTGGRGCRQAPQ